MPAGAGRHASGSFCVRPGAACNFMVLYVGLLAHSAPGVGHDGFGGDREQHAVFMQHGLSHQLAKLPRRTRRSACCTRRNGSALTHVVTATRRLTKASRRSASCDEALTQGVVQRRSSLPGDPDLSHSSTTTPIKPDVTGTWGQA